MSSSKFIDRPKFYYVRTLTWRHDVIMLLTLLGDVMWIAICIAVSLHFNNIFIYIISCWLIGMKQFSIGESLLHEAAHTMFLRSKKWNRFSEVILAYPFFLTIDAYRGGHWSHHRYYNTKRDPIITKQSKYGFIFKSFFIEWYVLPIIGYRTLLYTRDVYSRVKSNDWKSVALFWCALVVLFSFFGLIKFLFFYWLIPLFWCFSSFIFWSRFTDHYNTQTGTRSSTSWVYNLLISHNGGYHALHHLIPHIPYYQLPKFNKRYASELKSDYTSGLYETFKSIKMKYDHSL